MEIQGIIRKMRAVLTQPVSYEWVVNDQSYPLNACMGRMVTLTFSGEIRCIHCSRQIKKTYNQGYCYPCFIRLAACDFCILHPERCHFAQGTCRQPDWGLRHCMQTHVVYLANTSGIKVGITRASQVPTRWIDQGATQAIPVFYTQSRYVSGVLEVVFKALVKDKTNWRNMLRDNPQPVDMPFERKRLMDCVKPQLQDLFAVERDAVPFVAVEASPVTISYPVLRYPERIQSLSVKGETTISGQLLGIKGQYWLFEQGVINIRKYGGYGVTLTCATDNIN